MPDIEQKASALDHFVMAYHTAFEKALDAAGRERFPFHGDRTPLFYTFRCKDGIATFYMNVDSHPWENTPQGYRVYDHSELTLNLLCQACSANRLRILEPRIGEPDSAEVQEPIEIKDLPSWAKPWMINHAFLQDSIEKRDPKMPFPVIGIGPTVKVEAGIRKFVLPSRKRLWSPMVANSEGIKFRYFQWTYADFWWDSDNLNLNPERAKEVAELDLVALRTSSGADIGSAPAPIYSDSSQPSAEIFKQLREEFLELLAKEGHDEGATQLYPGSSQSSAEILEKMCEEFLELLAKEGHDENAIHRWLFEPSHRIFLDPYAVNVRSKIPFGDKESDFVIERPEHEYVLIEIEAATTPIFRKDNEEPHHKFNHAKQQVLDWQRYIRVNNLTMQHEQDLPEIYEPKGVVIIGRRHDIEGKEANRRWMDMRGTDSLDLLTYDDIIDRAKATADQLRRWF